MNATACFAHHSCGDARQFPPDTETLRMLRSIMVHAIVEAVRDGEHVASFRGFAIRAMRLAVSESRSQSQVNLAIAFDGQRLDQETIGIDVRNDGSAKYFRLRHAGGLVEVIEPLMPATVTNDVLARR